MANVKQRELLLVCACLLAAGIGSVAVGDWYPGDGHKMHYPQLPDPFGWDICVYDQWVADDFQCSEDGPIKDIHLWCSWLQDIEGWDIIENWDISI
jgi:hypothetical protein